MPGRWMRVQTLMQAPAFGRRSTRLGTLMLNRKITLVCAASALALMTACSSTRLSRNEGVTSTPLSSPGVVSSPSMSYGNVSSIELVPVATRSSAGGAVLGAVIGAVIGNQIGSGSGRAAATGVGAVGGAVIGNNLSRNRSETEVYRITVRMDSGTTAQYDYERIDDLRIGDRVRVDGGQLMRV